MIRLLNENDKKEFINMSSVFYSMPCCDHNIPTDHFESTFEYCTKENQNDYRVFIIEDNNKIVGYTSISISYSTEAGGKVVLIDEIFIKPEYQGKGYGHQVFDYIFKNYPAKRYRLECTPSNTRVIELYEKLGFTKLDYVQLIMDK